MPVLKNSSQTNWTLIGGVIIVVVIIIVAVVIMVRRPKETTTPKIDEGKSSGQTSMNELKEKVNDFQAGNAAAFKGNLDCYVDILFDIEGKLNISPDIIFDILQAGGLKATDYQPGLLSSISILSKTLKASSPVCNVYDPLDSKAKFAKAASGTIFNSSGLESVFKSGKDPIGAAYTEFSFLSLVYFLNNLYKEGMEKSIISQSNNLKLLNKQLIDANAFVSGATNNSGAPIVPYQDGGSVVITSPSTTINIYTSPAGTFTSPPSIDFGGDDGGDFNWGGDETTSTSTTTTTTTTTPMSLQDALQKKFAPFVAGKLRDVLLEKLKSFFPSGFEKMGATGEAALSIMTGVALTKVLQEGVKFIVSKLGSGSVVSLAELGKKLNLGPNGYEEVWNMFKGGQSWQELFTNTLSMYIKSVINEFVIPPIMDKAVNPAIDGIKKGMDSIPMIGSYVKPYTGTFATKAKDVILRILQNLGKKLGDWASKMALTAAEKLKTFFTDFMSNPIQAFKNLKADAGTAMSGVTWSSIWSEIRKGFATVLKEVIDSILVETGFKESLDANSLKLVYDKIDSIIGGSAKEPYLRNYRINDRRVDNMVNHITGVAEAYLDIGGFNKAITKEEFSYLRPQLSRFANTREFYTIMY